LTRFLRTSERLDEEMNRVDELKVDQSKKVRRTPYESLMYSLVAEKKSKRDKRVAKRGEGGRKGRSGKGRGRRVEGRDI